jgi:hypothetical protein
MSNIRLRVQNIIEDNSQTLVYEHVTSATRASNKLSRTNITASVSVKGHLRSYKQSEMAGLIQQGDRELRIAAASISFTPKPNDIVTDGTTKYKIVSVDSRKHRDVMIEHIMVVRGVHDDA